MFDVHWQVALGVPVTPVLSACLDAPGYMLQASGMPLQAACQATGLLQLTAVCGT
jgi:hypothetical protein